MTHLKHFRRLLAVGAAAAVVVAMSTVGADADDVTDATEPVLERTWIGEPSDRMEDVAFDLEQLVAENPNVFSGLAFASDFGAIEVYYAASEAKTADSLLDQVDANSTEIIRHERQRSLQNLLDLQQTTAQALTDQGVKWNGLGIDFYADGLTLGVPDSTAMSRSTSTVDLSALGIVSTEIDQREAVAYSPRFDAPRFTMGSQLIDNITYGGCSAGYPITLPNGTIGVLTAGHCGFGTYFNDGNPTSYIVGATYANTWGVSQQSYGDWQVLSNNGTVNNPGGMEVVGSNPDRVERFIYSTNDPVNAPETAKNLIVGMNYGVRTVGTTLCVTGATTGTSCRYRVHETNKMVPVGLSPTRTVGHVTVTFSDQNLDGTPDCGRTYYGDSGGPVWYERSTGGAIGYGIVTAGSEESDCPVGPSGRRYGKWQYSTQMSGVKALYPTAVIGGFLNGTS